jgi:DNA-binding winged helix-turn-helix (wHTH) protein
VTDLYLIYKGMARIFIINRNYEVNKTLNLVKDLRLNKEVRLEPRLMEVLSVLTDNVGKLVTREQLIKEIWDDYGGADEGLTQAISALRKTLNDVDKQIIETIPKKGYILNAVVANSQAADITAGKPVNNKVLLIIFVIAFILVAGSVLLYTQVQKGSGKKEQADSSKNTSVSFEDFNETKAENHLNTAVTVGPGNTEYKLVTAGEGRPKFYINKKLVSQDSMEKYSTLIQQMTNELLKRRKTSK